MAVKRKPDPFAAVQKWNQAHPVGTEVTVRKDAGDVVTGTAISAAYVLGGHTAVIHVTGISGCYALDRVEAV